MKSTDHWLYTFLKKSWLFAVYMGMKNYPVIYGDYFINHYFRIPSKQPAFNEKYPSFFFVARVMANLQTPKKSERGKQRFTPQPAHGKSMTISVNTW